MSFFDSIARTKLAQKEKNMQIFIASSVYRRIKPIFSPAFPQEKGGILLGSVENTAFGVTLKITGLIIPNNTEAFIRNLRFDHNIWKNIYEEKISRHPNTDILGWFFSYPDQQLIPTMEQLEIHVNFFKQNYHILLLLDPILETQTFFHWEGSQLVALPDFIKIDEDLHSYREKPMAILKAKKLCGIENRQPTDEVPECSKSIIFVAALLTLITLLIYPFID
ncbi:MAG: hypothetical protein M0Z31_07565 [Clostridia bacterium]|nr:hypothetical protein [Clostridia bacterium]